MTKNLVIILKTLEVNSHDSFWIYSFRKTADWNSYQKSDNLQYNTLGRWDEQLIDQASAVPSIIYFHNFSQT